MRTAKLQTPNPKPRSSKCRQLNHIQMNHKYMNENDFTYNEAFAAFAKKSKTQEISPGVIMEKFQQREDSTNYYYIFIR